ncbi:hypothetical protein MKC38_21275, partial [[Clostridium] innocuum]|nr:hypothetical protein [[Clostridium] innocuum]
FASLNKATIQDLTLRSEIDNEQDSAALAGKAKQTRISGVGILATIQSKGNASGMLVDSEETSITNSYVSGKITGGAGASGFVVLGNAEITSSYVSGIVEGKTAYGFGKQAAVSDSYAAVYVDGSESGSFNGEGSKLEGCFYDVSVASKEEARAQEYTNAQMISGTLPV